VQSLANGKIMPLHRHGIGRVEFEGRCGGLGGGPRARVRSCSEMASNRVVVLRGRVAVRGLGCVTQ